jgi:hypothetical protein
VTKHRKTIVVSGVILVTSYIGLTWFFFGSSHPCGILEARWKPYAVRIAYKSKSDELSDFTTEVGRKLRENKFPEFPEESFQRLVEGKATNRDRLALGVYQDMLNARTKQMEESSKQRQEEHQRISEELRSTPQTEARRVRERAWSLTPAECTWQAITWNPSRE